MAQEDTPDLDQKPHHQARKSDAPASRPSRAERLIVLVAALVCFFFATTLRDVALRPLPIIIPAPPIPAGVAVRDAGLEVIVVDEAEKPIVGASVRVFAMHEGKAYFAGDRSADETGRARFGELPRGEVWILAYGAGRARASRALVLGEGTREERLMLKPARALDIIVVDESERPIDGAVIEVTSADPLPYGALTAGGGKARVDRLGPPPYRVRASARGYDDALKSGVVPGAAPLRIRLERLATLEVRVVDKDKKPAAGATVLAAGTGLWPARSTLTDDQGFCRISGLRGGVYDLKARRDDDVSPTEFAVPVKRGQTKEVELMLEPGKRVRVTVTDGDGDNAPPVKSAAVILAEEGLTSFPLQGRTDERGVIELGPIGRDRAVVSARAPGFVPTSAVAIAIEQTEVKVPLRRGGALVGDVVDDRGYPVSGASIEVVGVDLDGLPIDETTAMIDFRDEHFEFALAGPTPLIPIGELGVMPGPIPDLPHGPLPALPSEAPRGGDPWVTRVDGTFRADPIPPGRVHAIVRHPDYVEAISEAVTVRSGAEATVHIVLRQGGWIEGRVLEDDRSPVPGARIELAATHGSLERVAYAADDGTFTFAAVPDEVLLSVSRPDAPADVVAQVVVKVPDRDRQEVEIVLPKAREHVAIHVTDDRGYALDRVEIHAVSLDVGEPLRRTLFTDDAGDAELRSSVGLPLRVTLLSPGRAPRIEQIDSAPPKLTFTLDPGLRAHGVVTARGGRDRLEGADVALFTAAGVRRARTDAEGAFEVDDLAPGRVRITVDHPEHASAEVVTTIAGDADHPADLGSIDLKQAGEVEGEVVDENDEPVPGARVAKGNVPTYLPFGPLPRGIVATNREGHFKLGGLPEGRISLEAYIADLGRGAVDDIEVRAGRTTDRVKIVLAGGASSAREPKGAGSLAVTLGERGRAVVVMMVPPGSEAEIAGIEPGDQIMSVNGREVTSIEAARKRLTGPLSEDVVLALRRDEGGNATEWLLRVKRERVRR